MKKSDINKLKEIEEFFKKLDIYDKDFFNEVVYHAKIINYHDIDIRKHGFNFKINEDGYELILPTGIPNIKLRRLEFCIKAYQEYLKHSKNKKEYKYPYMLVYGALRIYVEENFSKKTIDEYNMIQRSWLYSSNTSEDEVLGILMQYEIAKEYFTLGYFNVPDEFYLDKNKLEEAKETLAYILEGKINYL